MATSEKKRTTKIIVIALIAFVVITAIGLVAANIYSNYISNGGQQRSTISFESKHYKVNNCMYTYYNFSGIYSYGAYLSYMGLDMSKPLSAQECSYVQADQNGNPGTWQQYFIQQSANSVMGYLCYAEAAKDAGYEYDNLDADIEKQLNSLKDSAKEVGYENFEEYLKAYYADFVKEEDVRDALKLQIFANKYYEKVQEDTKGALTEDDYNKYLEATPEKVKKIDYMSYAVTADVAEDADEATKQVAYNAAKAKADTLLAAATGEESFAAWVTADLKEKNATAETPQTDEEINEQATKVNKEQGFSENDDFSTWAFDANRTAGEATVIDNGSGTYTVYYLIKTPYLLEYDTKNVRHILLKSEEENAEIEEKAKSVLDEFKAGDKSEASFDALAQKNNEDSNSLYNNVTKGQMVTEFNDWIFAEARQPGDTDIVKTQYGYHIMYYIGNGLKAWQAEVATNLTTDKTGEITKEWQEKYPVDYTKGIYEIPDTIPTVAATSMTSAASSNIVAG